MLISILAAIVTFSTLIFLGAYLIKDISIHQVWWGLPASMTYSLITVVLTGLAGASTEEYLRNKND